MLEFYDSLFRYWAVGLFILLGVSIVRDFGWRLPVVLGALSSFSGAAYLLESIHENQEALGVGLYLLWPLNAAAPVFIWLFSLTQFEDHFKLKPMHYGVAGGFLLAHGLMVYLHRVVESPYSPHLFNALSASRLLLLMHMIYVAWQGREDDLLEARRRFRMLYVVLVTAFTGSIIIVETWARWLVELPWIYLLQSSASLVLALALVWRVLKADPRIVLIGESTREPAAHSCLVGPNEKHDLKRVLEVVDADRIYLEPNLTIAGLADKVQMPAHKLRHLINQHMGYRNFSDFLNHYRINLAKERLADAGNRRQQVLVLAMDLGYGSLGPFNRAFKERTGLTPSEFRKNALAEIE